MKPCCITENISTGNNGSDHESASHRNRRTKCSLLVVDNDSHVLLVFSSLLAHSFDVVTAECAEAARDAFMCRDINIVLTSLRMHNTNGMQILEWVREQHPKSIRLLMFEWDELNDAMETIESGLAYHHVIRPWRIEELQQILRNSADKYMLERRNEELLALTVAREADIRGAGNPAAGMPILSIPDASVTLGRLSLTANKTVELLEQFNSGLELFTKGLDETPEGASRDTAAPGDSPSDGTIRDNRIYLDGKPYALTQGLRGLLAYLMENNGATLSKTCKHCGYTDESHLHKRLNDLRNRLSNELKSSERTLRIHTEKGRIYCDWKDRPALTKK